jgi:hypothetical protein
MSNTFAKQSGRGSGPQPVHSNAAKKISDAVPDKIDELKVFCKNMFLDFEELKSELADQKRHAEKQAKLFADERELHLTQITNMATQYSELDERFKNVVKIQNEMQFKLLQYEVSMRTRSMQNSVHGPMPAGAAAPAVSEYASALAAPGTPCSAQAGRGTYAGAVGGAAAKAVPAAPNGTQRPSQPSQPSPEAQERTIVLTTSDTEQIGQLGGAKLTDGQVALTVRTTLRGRTGDAALQVAGARVMQTRKPGGAAAAGTQPEGRVTVVVTLQTSADVQAVREAARSGKLKPWSVRPWRTQEQQQMFVKLQKDHIQGLAKARAEKRWWRANRTYTRLEVFDGNRWTPMQPDAEHAAGGAGGGVEGAAAPAAGSGEGQH